MHTRGIPAPHYAHPDYAIRNEKENLHLPKELPTVVSLQTWLARVAQALASNRSAERVDPE